MGMFDTIIVKCNIPGHEDKHEFQSKSLECLMDEYEITQDGKLVQVFESCTQDTTRTPLDDFSGDLEIHDGHISFICRFLRGQLHEIIPYDRYSQMYNDIFGEGMEDSDGPDAPLHP